MLIAVMVIGLLVFIYSLLGMARVDKVFDYRGVLIDTVGNNSKARLCQIKQLSDEDINKNFPRVMEMYKELEVKNREAWAAFEEVSFSSMCNKLWKPIDSFYTDEQLAKMTWDFDPIVAEDSSVI